MAMSTPSSPPLPGGLLERLLNASAQEVQRAEVRGGSRRRAPPRVSEIAPGCDSLASSGSFVLVYADNAANLL